jgi:hypothetical protein
LYAYLAYGDGAIAVDLAPGKPRSQLVMLDRSGEPRGNLLQRHDHNANPAMLNQMVVARDRLYWAQPGDQVSPGGLLSVRLAGGRPRVELEGGAMLADLGVGPDFLVLARGITVQGESIDVRPQVADRARDLSRRLVAVLHLCPW